MRPAEWSRASAEVGEEVHGVQLAVLGVANGARELGAGEALPRGTV